MSLSLREQAIFTANALTKMASSLDVSLSQRGASDPCVAALIDHAEDLMRAISLEYEPINALLNSLAAVGDLMWHFRSELSSSIFGLPCICNTPRSHSDICVGIRKLFLTLDHTTVIANKMRTQRSKQGSPDGETPQAITYRSEDL